MDYASPANFDTISSAVEFIKTQLQSEIDRVNEATVNNEKSNQKIKILQEQIDELNSKAQDLIQYIGKLEEKREVIKRELKEHATKVTDRLDKERADFEATRAKIRATLDETDKSLVQRQEQLEQVEIQLNARESTLNDLEKRLEQRENDLVEDKKSLSRQIVAFEEAKSQQEKRLKVKEDEIQKTVVEVAAREQHMSKIEAGLISRQKAIEEKDAQTEKYRDEAIGLMSLAEVKMTKIESVAKKQLDREERLNAREAGLIEVDKSLTRRKIQLNDREATIKSHGSI